MAFGRRDVPASPRVFELAGASYLKHVGCVATPVHLFSQVRVIEHHSILTGSRYPIFLGGSLAYRESC